MSVLLVRTCLLPEVNRREILRYAGARSEAPESEAVLEECLAQAEGRLTPQVCYREFPLKRVGNTLDLGFVKTDSAALGRHLAGCHGIVLFAATVGARIDRLIARYSAVSPARALLFQAIGTERIETLCDIFCREIAAEKNAEGAVIRPRFSPGYGDLPLEIQREIFAVLDCARRIGLSLNESLLMSPSKSVTAIVGIAKNAGE